MAKQHIQKKNYKITLQQKAMTKNILFSTTSWKTFLKKESDARIEADKSKEDKINKVSQFQENPDDTHYPSEKLVKEHLSFIKNELKQEQQRAITVEESLRNDLSANEKNCNEIQSSITDLEIAIETETSRAKKVEEILRNDLDEEIEATDRAGIVLQNNIFEETNRAEAAEKSLNEKIETEILRATNTEKEILESISKIEINKNESDCVYDGGKADSVYGGAININCGGAA